MTALGPYELNQIYTGDARELAKAIPDESVDLFLTDPPFGIGFKYNNGYEDDPKLYPDLLRNVITIANRIIKPGGLSFVFQSMKQIQTTLNVFPPGSKIFAACKNFVQGGNSKILQMFDPVIYWQKEGVLNLSGDFRRDWYIANTAYTNRKRDNDFHSCPRPLDTIMYMVENFSPTGGIVCDLFMGSGTTAVACNLTGRQYIGFEIDPDTAEKARERVRNTQPPLPFIQPIQETIFK